MRPRLPLFSAVLAAALLVGQWLCAAHETEHGLQPGSAQVCAVCVYAHGAGAGMLPALPNLALARASGVPAAPVVARTLESTLRHHPIRGPPALLA